MLSPIISIMIRCSFVSTGVGIISRSSSAKTDSRFAWAAVVLLVTDDTNSRFGMLLRATFSVEAFPVTEWLQGSARTNQRLPCIATQWGGAVFTVSNQREKRIGVLVNNKKLDLMTDLHTKADLREGCAPVGRQFGLLMVKTSLSSCYVECNSVAPKLRIVVESSLKRKTDK